MTKRATRQLAVVKRTFSHDPCPPHIWRAGVRALADAAIREAEERAGSPYDGVCPFKYVAEIRGDEDTDQPRCPADIRGACTDTTCVHSPARQREQQQETTNGHA